MLNRNDLLHLLINKIKTSDEFNHLSTQDQNRLESALNQQFLAPDLNQILQEEMYDEIDEAFTILEKKTFQIKISIKGAKPPIWRRVLIPNTLSFHQLHEVIQTVMGWTNTHLYSFHGSPGVFECPDEEYEFRSDSARDSNTSIIGNFLVSEKDTISYTYDFGDDWEHQILLESITWNQGLTFPVCIKGKRNCPLEDSGGIHHYQHVLKVLSNNEKMDEDAQFFRERFGDHDPEKFDLEETNELLKIMYLEDEMADDY
ncbi:plasmid pRiA4b ORF-3 family protein [Rossellomorea aquimaris]|uniref:plasmid pRiA4b ORF-3 family protein n=1 Tax=Rossellomorea aquimaris TaxID=189382 RepID=UPI0006982F8F|nr:plasmid pRiA4b ORF-3 family protein [Rossellomorea aquimaris]